MALIGDSIGQSAVENSLPAQRFALGNPDHCKAKDISGYGLLTYLFLLCIFLTDTADLSLIARFAKTIVLDAPTSHTHATLALLVFIPAIGAAFVGSFASSKQGRLTVLATAAFSRCVLIAVFLLTMKFADFACWQSQVCISLTSFLCAYAFVPRLCWMINMRKQSFAAYFQLVLFGMALFASVVLYKQSLSTTSFCQMAFVASALASIGFRVLARNQTERKSTSGGLSKLSYLITAKSFTALIGLALWGCLAFANIEQYQVDENSLLNFAAMSCLGILLGAAVPFLKLTRAVTSIVAMVCKSVATLLLLVFGFSGNFLPAQTFVLIFMALWSAAYMCELNVPKGKAAGGSPSVSAGLEKSVAWGLAVVLTTTLLICLATGTGVDTISSAIQLRKFALVSGIVALLSLIFVNRTWARRLSLL